MPAPTPVRPLQKDAILVALGAVPFACSAALLLAGMDGRGPLILLAVVCLSFTIASLLRVHQQLGRTCEIGLLVLLGANLFWFWAPAVLVAFSEEQWNTSAAAIVIENRRGLQAFFAVTGFALMEILAYQFFVSTPVALKLARVAGDGHLVRIPNATRLLLILTVVSLGFYVLSAGGLGKAVDLILASRSGDKPWDSQGNYGTAVTPFHFFFSSLLAVVCVYSLFLLMSYRLRPGRRFFLGAVTVIALLSIVVESGTRSVALLSIVPPVLLYYRHNMALRGSRRWTRFALVGVLLVGTVAVASFQRYYRDAGEIDETFEIGIVDNDFFTGTAFAIEIYERLPQPTFDSPLLHIITGPVPRVLWSGKPDPEVTKIYSAYVWGVDITKKGGNTIPGIVGQYLLSWGWLGVFEIGLWLGLLVRLADSVLAVTRVGSMARLPMAVFFMYLFVVYRFIGFNFFMPVPLAFILAHWILGRAGRPTVVRRLRRSGRVQPHATSMPRQRA